jgi:hypothetical protein
MIFYQGGLAMSTDEKKNETKKDNTALGKEGHDPCLRCGDPVEIDGDILCKKCEGEVH